MIKKRAVGTIEKVLTTNEEESIVKEAFLDETITKTGKNVKK